MLQHVAFLEAIAEAPASAVDRLAYADWLEEQAEPLSEVLRVQAQALQQSEDREAVEQLARRERQLLLWHRERGQRLLGELAAWPEAAGALWSHVLTPVLPAPEGFVCPTCGEDEHRRQGLSSPFVLGWALSPGATLSELLLGERVPAVTYQCAGCGEQYVRCPNCRAFLSDEQVPFNAANNWGGYACPLCRASIPVVHSAITAAVGLTARLVTGYGWLWGRQKAGP